MVVLDKITSQSGEPRLDQESEMEGWVGWDGGTSRRVDRWSMTTPG